MKSTHIRLEDLLVIGDESAVLREVEHIASMTVPSLEPGRLRAVFGDIMALYSGACRGYAKCDAEYHDLGHTLGVFIAMARLMHGACSAGVNISGEAVFLGLVSSLFHDVGYLRADGENHGTGAQFTSTHVARSIRLMQAYFTQHGFTEEDFIFCRKLLYCTDLSLKTGEIAFSSTEERLLGHMLGTADILGQTAERAYLEKLLLLYREFREGNIGDYESELALLESTPGFFYLMQHRLEHDLGNVQAYLGPHFRIRWRIDRDLYTDAARTNLNFLNTILSDYRHDYRSRLQRDGIVQRLQENTAADGCQ